MQFQNSHLKKTDIPELDFGAYSSGVEAVGHLFKGWSETEMRQEKPGETAARAKTF